MYSSYDEICLCYIDVTHQQLQRIIYSQGIIAMPKMLRSLMVIGLTLSLLGCGSSSIPIDDLRLMNNVSGLDRVKGDEPSIVFKRPGAPTLASYHKFIIDPIQIDYSDADMKELAPEDITKFQNYFSQTLAKELTEGGYEVTTLSAPGTLRISITLSGLKASDSDGLVNVSGMVASAAVGVPGVYAINVGQVTVETALRNAETNRLDAVVVDTAAGSHFFNDKPWSTWADVEDALDNWAIGIREAVDKAHGS